jgi:Flp pilus assembly protein TadD
LKCYEECLRINPGVAVVYTNLGVARAGLGRFEEAIRSFDESIAINPHDPTPWNNKAASLRRLGRDEEAEDCAGKVRELTKGRDIPWILR